MPYLHSVLMSENRWVIGYAVPEESPTAGTWRDTRLGGYPVWPPGRHPEISACPLCNRPRLLLLQAFAPHNAHNDRVLFIFVCNSAVCSRQNQSWVAYRGIKWNEELVKKNTVVQSSANEVDEINWDSTSDSDSTASEESGDLESLLKIQNLQISDNKSKKSAEQLKPTRVMVDNTATTTSKSPCTESRFLRPHFVDVEFEPKKRDNADSTQDDVQRLLKVYETEEKQLRESDTCATNWDVEDDAEETEEVVANDEFQSAIELAPEQVLRYKFRGKPVLWPRHPPPKLREERCERCNSANVFEVQVLGTVLFYLEPERAVASSQQEAALNFLAVALFTCEKDCQASDVPNDEGKFEYRKVNVVVQTDIW